jgi:hypothetical protein
MAEQGIELEIGDLNNSKAVLGVIGIMLLPFVALFLQTQGVHLFQLRGSTTCVDGVSEVYMDSNVRDYENNKAWTVQFSNGCNEKIAGGGGTIDSENIESSSDGNVVRANKDFSLGLTDFEAYFFKTIDRSNSEEVFDYETKAFECTGGWGSTLVGGCTESDKQEVQDWQDNGANSDKWEFIEYRDPGWLGSDYYVASRPVEKQGEIYEFSFDSGSDFQGEVTLCADGDCGSATITKDQPIAEIGSGDNKAEVEWRGSRIEELRNVDFSAITPVWVKGEGIKVAASQHTEEYSRGGPEMRSCLRNNDIQAIEFCNPDDKRVNALNDNRQILEDNLGIINGKVVAEDNEVRVVAESETAIEDPVFVATIDTGWIGLIEQAPKPRIGALRDFSMKEQDSVTVQVPVTNEGKRDGRIRTSIQCEGPVNGGSQSQNLVSGETRTYEIQVSARSGVPDLYSCDVEAQATGTTADGATDTSTFAVTLRKKSEECSDCFGSNPNNGGEGGTGEVVRPPEETGVNWLRLGTVIGVILLIAGTVWWWRENR